MSDSITAITDSLLDTGLSLTKAIPRGQDHLLVELAGPSGPVAGQWFADPDRAHHVYTRTRSQAGDHVRLYDRHLLLQPEGADRRLPALAAVLATPGTALVAHRPEQRGVVRQTDPSAATRYLKIVRPKRLERTVAGLRLRAPGVHTPDLLDVDRERAVVTMSHLPGRMLFDLLADPEVPEARLRQAAHRVGGTLARLHRTPAEQLAGHDARAELAVVDHWAAMATAHGLTGPEPHAAALRHRAAEHLAGPAEPAGLIHRDLHDKQILVGPEQTGILDFDLAARGEPALDLANLLVHLQLRAHQEHCSGTRARAVAHAVLDGYGPMPRQRRVRIAGYAATTAARLAHVYAFRPASAAAAAALAAHPGGPLADLEEMIR